MALIITGLVGYIIYDHKDIKDNKIPEINNKENNNTTKNENNENPKEENEIIESSITKEKSKWYTQINFIYKNKLIIKTKRTINIQIVLFIYSHWVKFFIKNHKRNSRK